MVRWQISAILGGAATVAIAAAALIADTSTIKQDLIARTAQVLAGEATSWASVEIVGRDAYLSGAAPSEDLRALAVARLQRVFGIRRVDDSAATLLADVKPYRFAVERLADNEVRLEGFAPSLPDRARLDAALRAAVPSTVYIDSLELARGAPDERFLTVATQLMPVARSLRTGRIELVDHAVTIAGEAMSNAEYDKLRAKPPVLPAPYALGRFDIVRPVASPYTWSVDLRDGMLAVGGFTPDPATHTRLAAAVRAEATGRTVHDRSDLASGEPSGFADVVEEAIDYLDLMAEAHVGFSDRNITIAGRATTPGSYRTLTAYLETWAPSGFNVQSSIDLPVVTPYTLTASRMAGRVTVTGFAPDDTARDIIADAATSQSQGPAVVEVTLADGAPNGFAGAARFALDLLDKCSSGTVLLSDGRIRLEGVAKTGGDLIELEAAAANPPEGFEVDLNADPPVVSPYVWQIEKTADQLILSGSSPSEDLRSAISSGLDETVPDLAVYDKTSVATGLADDVDLKAVANRALEVLAHLKRGTVTLSDRTLSVSGQATSAAERSAAMAALDTLPAGLVKGVITIESSITFRLVIERGLDTVTIDGAVPDEATQAALQSAVDRMIGKADVLASLEIDSALPSGTGDAERLAVRAASLIAKGRVSVEDGVISVSGQAFTGVGATRLSAELSPALPAGYRLAAAVGAAPDEPEIDAATCRTRLADVLKRNGVLFEPGSALPSTDSRGLIDRLGAIALSCPSARIDIVGHADAGADAADLGQARAAAVADALEEIGVDRARLDVTASGSALSERAGAIDVVAKP